MGSGKINEYTLCTQIFFEGSGSRNVAVITLSVSACCIYRPFHYGRPTEEEEINRELMSFTEFR
jgi:hypothetical protein